MLPDVDLPTTTTARLSAGKIDGFYIQEAALASGMNVDIFPDDVLLVSSAASAGEELSFVRGVPVSSTLAGVSYIQERRIRRAILQRGGLPIPTGATFSLRRGLPGARRYAKRIGYPVVLKAARGAGTTEIVSGIQDEDMLNRALNNFSVPPALRSGYVRPVIAPPEFVPPAGGRENLPSSYRILIEKDRPGIYVRALVVCGEVHSVIECSKGPWSEEPADYSDMSQSVDADLLFLAKRVGDLVPGVEVLAVDFLVDDTTKPVTGQNIEIVEVSEQPWLYVQEKVDVDLARTGARKILQSHGQDSLVTVDGRQELSVRLRGAGVTEASDFADSLVGEALPGLGLAGAISHVDNLAGTVGLEIAGTATDLAYLAQSLVDGTQEGLHCVHLCMEPGSK